MSDPARQPESLWPHRIALAMACATFPLIWLGSLVTTHQAGMAVPDWPNTYGYNLFLYPLSTWVAGPFDLFIEHGHRLLGATVGVLAIALVIVVFATAAPRWLRVLSIVALVAVCLQGALGGLRVLFDARTLAMVHGCVGPAFFALAAAIAALTARRQPASTRDDRLARFQRLALVTAGLTYLQLILGAQLRHTPVDAGPGFFRTALFFHLLVATALTVHIVLLTTARRSDGTRYRSGIFGPLLMVLIVVQLGLGSATWVVKYGWPRWVGEFAFTAGYIVQREDFWGSLIVTAHVATGSLILASSVLVALQAFQQSAENFRFSFQRVIQDTAPMVSSEFKVLKRIEVAA